MTSVLKIGPQVCGTSVSKQSSPGSGWNEFLSLFEKQALPPFSQRAVRGQSEPNGRPARRRPAVSDQAPGARRGKRSAQGRGRAGSRAARSWAPVVPAHRAAAQQSKASAVRKSRSRKQNHAQLCEGGEEARVASSGPQVAWLEAMSQQRLRNF